MTGHALTRVLHVTPAFAPAYVYGGPVSSTEGLVVGLKEAGVDVRVLTTDANGTGRLAVERGWTTWRGVPVRYERRLRAPDLAPSLLWQTPRLVRESHLIHISALFSAPSAVALLASRAARKSIVFAPKGALLDAAMRTGSVNAKKAWLDLLRPHLRHVLFHATSEEEAESVRLRVAPDARVVVVPHGTTLEGLGAARARKARRRPTRPTIVALGRLHPIKAQDRLLGAVALLRDKGIDVEARFAGPKEDSSYARSLERLVVELKLTDRVRFDGPLEGEEKLDFFAAGDVLCLPSHSENFGIVAVEALGACTPVVASRATPWRALAEERAGDWVENTAEALAHALEPFVKDREVARAAGERGRALAEARFTWRAVAAQMKAAYDEELRRNGRSGMLRSRPEE